jgi:hypothetical protein
MRNKTPDAITWLQIHNFLPIVGLIVAVVGGYNLVTNALATQSQRIDYLTSSINTCLGSISAVQSDNFSQALDIKELQTKGSVKGASTSVQQPTPISVKPGVDKGEQKQ